MMQQLIAGAVVAATLGTGAAAALQDTDAAGPTEPGVEARHGRHRGRVLAATVRLVADELGIEPADVVAHVRDGGTIAELATEHGVDPDALEAAIIEAATAKLDEAVAQGRITEERAAELLARLPEMVNRFVNEPHDRGARHPRRHHLREVAEIVAETIGIDAETLRDELLDGGSIADVATAHSVDPADVEAALLAALSERLDAAVAAERIDEDRAAEIEAGAPARIHDLVTKERPARDAATP
jgi:uncharacterized protein (DUF433 family)